MDFLRINSGYYVNSNQASVMKSLPRH